MTIPDYTLYVTTGITCALAWGLPTKPIYPDEELMQQYEKGRLPLIQYRKDKNATNSNSTGEINVPASNHTSNLQSSNFLNQFYKNGQLNKALWNYFNYLQRRRPDSYYFSNSSNSNYCNHRTCSYNKYFNYNKNYYTNQKPYTNIRPSVPYSPNYDTTNQYAAFTRYMIDKYLKPTLNSYPNRKAASNPTTNTSQ